MSKKTEETEIHEYDGILELDNQLPRWWLVLLYLTILFSGGYYAYYELGNGPSLITEYHRDRTQMELASLAASSQVKELGEEDLIQLVKDTSRVKQGKDLFSSRCASCHGAEGQGGIGPNLTDRHWLHGGKMVQVAQTITKGVGDKGMPPWGGAMSQEEIHSVVAFIRSILGTTPAGAKAPQGELFAQ